MKKYPITPFGISLAILLLLNLFPFFLFSKIIDIGYETTSNPGEIRFIVNRTANDIVQYGAIALYADGSYETIDTVKNEFTHRYGTEMEAGEVVEIFLAVIYDEEDEEDEDNRQISVILPSITAPDTTVNYAPEMGGKLINLDFLRSPSTGYETFLVIEYLKDDSETWQEVMIDLFKDSNLWFQSGKKSVKNKSHVFVYPNQHRDTEAAIEYGDVSTRVMLPDMEQGDWGRIFLRLIPAPDLEFSYLFTNTAELRVEGEKLDGAHKSERMIQGYDPSSLSVTPADFWKKGEPLRFTLVIQNDGYSAVDNVEVKIALSKYLNLKTFRILSWNHGENFRHVELKEKGRIIDGWKGRGAPDKDVLFLDESLTASTSLSQTDIEPRQRVAYPPSKPIPNYGRRPSGFEAWAPYTEIVKSQDPIASMKFKNVGLLPYAESGDEIYVVFEVYPKTHVNKDARINNVAFVKFEKTIPYRTNTTTNTRANNIRRHNANAVIAIIGGTIAGFGLVFKFSGKTSP